MSRIFLVNSNCYHGYSIEEALDGIKSAGFKYVELTATKGWTEHVFPDQSFEYLQMLKDRMEEMDIIPYAMSGHCNLMDKERLQDFLKNIKLAHFFGSKVIVSSVGEAHLEDKEVTPESMLIENIRSLIPYLEKYDMEMVLETHGNHGTGEILNQIVCAVDSPRVGINYDTANVIYWGNTRPETDIDTCMENIRYVHIKDQIGGYQNWNFPALGDGEIDLPLILNKLDQIGNDIPISLEIEFTAEGSRDVEEVHEAVRKSAEYLKKLGMRL